jgi:hypothetical protein
MGWHLGWRTYTALAPESFLVHYHKPEDFHLYFASTEDREKVLRDEVLSTPYFDLLLRPWSRRTHAASIGLYMHAEIGIATNAWSLSTAEAVMAPFAWAERLHLSQGVVLIWLPSTSRHAAFTWPRSCGMCTSTHRAGRASFGGRHGGADVVSGVAAHQHAGISAPCARR